MLIKQLQSKLSRPALAMMVTIFIYLLATVLIHNTAQAASFEPGRIIDNGKFTNKDAMNAGDIQNFLNSKVPTCDTYHAPGSGAAGSNPPWTCLKDYSEGGRNAANIINDAAKAYSINPQVLLVTLQKENGLITDSWPYPWQYRTAMGFGCPDGAPCDAQWFGFTNQVNQAARHFRNFYNNNPNWFIPFTPGVRSIKWNPNAACGSSNVNIVNQATAALYSYTPYQPNAAALNNLYGTGDGCSSYGNRNFWRDFTNWFGSTLDVDYNSSYYSQSDYPTIAQGQSATVFITYQNTGNSRWCDDDSYGACGGGTRPVHLSTSHPVNRNSALGNTWGGDRNRPTGNFAYVYKSDGVTPADDQNIANPGEIVKFQFVVSAPVGTPGGVHREYFQPIVEGGSAMNDPGTYLDITVQTPIYTNAYYSQSGYPSLIQGQSTNSHFMYKNTGNMPWYDDVSVGTGPIGTKPVHLATTNPINRNSIVGSSWGGDRNRPANTFNAVYEANGTTLAADQHIVQPGQIAKFQFVFSAPIGTPGGTYREFFQPIVEGGSMMNFVGTFLDVNVQTPVFTAQYYSQSGYPTIARGNQATSFFMYKNTGNVAWYDDSSVGTGPAGSKPTHLATFVPINRRSSFGSTWGGDQNRAAGTFTAVYEANGSTLASNQHIAQPGQIVKLQFIFTTPNNLSSGNYREYFQPIIEGGSLMNAIGTFLDITVP